MLQSLPYNKLFNCSVTITNQHKTCHLLYSDKLKSLPQQFGQAYTELSQATCRGWREVEILWVIWGHHTQIRCAAANKYQRLVSMETEVPQEESGHKKKRSQHWTPTFYFFNGIPLSSHCQTCQKPRWSQSPRTAYFLTLVHFKTAFFLLKH